MTAPEVDHLPECRCYRPLMGLPLREVEVMRSTANLDIRTLSVEVNEGPGGDPGAYYDALDDLHEAISREAEAAHELLHRGVRE